jgi:hypothetical protein
MFRAMDCFFLRLAQSPRPRKTAIEALTSQGVLVFLQPSIGWYRISSPPKPDRPSVTGWCALNGLPNRLDPAFPEKNGFPFPPEVTLGGFLIDKPQTPGRFLGRVSSLSRSLHPHTGL